MWDIVGIVLLIYFFVGVPYLVARDFAKSAKEDRPNLSAFKYLAEGIKWASGRVVLIVLAGAIILLLINVAGSMLGNRAGYESEYYRR